MGKVEPRRPARQPWRLDAVLERLASVMERDVAPERVTVFLPTDKSTASMLAAQYSARAVIPLEIVARDYFSHLDPAKLARKVTDGEIRLPILRIDPTSQKSAKGVHVQDLADWIDRQRAAAQKEVEQMGGVR